MPPSTRVRERPVDVLRYCGIQNGIAPSCWECRFFAPPVGVDRDVQPTDDCAAGDCRRHPPVIDHDHRDASANWAVFPLVMACDWCGEFDPRRAPLAHTRDDEASAAFDAASQDDATDANRGANGGVCQCGSAECHDGSVNATDRQTLGTPPETQPQ
jgi:hypothetical protein